MDDERPSQTAEIAALLRALHQKLDGEPKILDDPISPRLFDEESAFYKSALERLGLPPALISQLKTTVVIRSRFAEDRLADVFQEGVHQYVLLGAGLDTFAYRQPPWANALRIFEVDHSATQRWKLRRLMDAKISVPRNVTFVPLDFEKDTLTNELSQAGFDSSAATFFSMLGVSHYLTEAAFDKTLKFVLSARARSEIVFSFAVADTILDAGDVARARAASAHLSVIREPALLRFHPDQLVAKLTEMGFSKVFHLTPGKANERYFQNRSDGLNAAILEQMMRATV
jgi:methyltransferase (TIGR00027 family)